MKIEERDPTSSASHFVHRSGATKLFDRGQFLQEFESVFSRSVPSHSGCLSIEGGWGMGKTALLNAACLIADRSSCLVIRARGGDLEQHAPFGALLRIIEVVASLRNADQAISDRIEAVFTLIDQHGERNFSELGAAFYGLLTAVRRLGPVLVAIDDADLVDEATLMTLEYAFHRIDDQQIWLLLSAASRLPGMGPRAIDHLLINQHVRHFVLTPLNAENVSSLLSEYSEQAPDPEFVEAVLDATGGRPEFAIELIKACRAQRIAPIAELAVSLSALPIPRISQRVLSKLGRLAQPASSLLEACAILGDTSDLSSACHLAKIDPLMAEGAADSAARAELLQNRRPLTFTAPIVRWVFLQDIPSARRSQLHAQSAQYLSETGADETSVVEHLLSTEPSGDLELASRLASAGREFVAHDDFRRAAECLRRAIGESPITRQEASWWLDLASCEIQLGLKDSVASFQRAIALGVSNDDHALRVAVQLMRPLRDWPELRVEAVTALRKLSASIDAGDPSLQLEFVLGLTILAGHPAQRSDGAAKIEALLARVDTASAATTVARAFLDIRRFESDPDVSAQQIIQLLGPVLDSEEILMGDLSSETVQSRACRMLLNADQFAGVDNILEAARRRARSLGDSHSEDNALRLMVLSKFWQGALDEAEEAYLRHYELGGAWTSQPVIGSADLLVAQGRAGEALDQLASRDFEDIDEPLERATAHVEHGRLLAVCGQVDQALDEFQRASEIAERGGVTNSVLVGWRPPTAHALASLGCWDEAHAIAEDHLVFARAFGARRSLGTALRAMAATSTDLDERIAWLSESVEVLEGSYARLDTAEAMVDLGAALVDRRDIDNARDLLRKGATIASSCKAHGLVDVARSHLRAAGARPRRLGSTGVDSLTPAELRAVTMAAANATNRSIADELFVNVKTIEGHLSRAYRKLGVTSRFELAEVLRSRGRYEAHNDGESERVSLPGWSER